MKLGGKNVEVDGRLVRVGRLAAEGFEFVEDPEAMFADIVMIRSGMDRPPLSPHVDGATAGP